MGIEAWFEKENSASVFPDYGRIRIENYAEAFRDLAFNFTKFDLEEMREGESRREYLIRRRESEQWQKLGERFSDAAVVMKDIAAECYSYRQPGRIRMASLRVLLHREGVALKNAYVIRNRYHHMEYCLTMQVAGSGKKTAGKNRRLCETEIAAAILSGVFGRKIQPAQNCPLFIGDECREYMFAEEGIYHVAVGTAAAVKKGESISGDNYSILSGGNGKVTVLLSDGVGSGEEACRDSSHLIDLAEKYLETGFDKKQTLGILEGIMMGNAMENRMPTLDICEVDLHTGECEMIKLGSAPSLIKFDRMIDVIPSDNLLLGYEKIEDISVVGRQVKEDNYIVMMTDGVSDYFKEDEKKELFGRMISTKGYKDPTVLANYIMDVAVKQSDQGIRDDMTVIVLKIEQTVD